MISHGKISLSRATVNAWVPPPRLSSFEWICENAVTKRGDPFDQYSFPWTRGICEAWDDPKIERIFYQAGSRLGKTELGLALLACSMANDPDIAMIGGPTGDKVSQWIGDRLVPMLKGCVVTRSWVPPAHKRSKYQLPLRHGHVYGAWSGSPTTLGDLDPRYLLAFEIDKFTKNSSEEADSLLLLLERGAEIPDRRVYCESTPTVTGLSRVERYVNQGTNERFHVPCPKCKKFQPLERGRGKPGDHGVIWDHNEDGHSEPTLAYKTARYRCKYCLREIHEDQRVAMVQKGVWCPKGAMVDKRGRVRGKTFNDGPDRTFQLGRLYGSTFSFGRYARAYVDAVHDDDPEAFRSFLNNWDGESWQQHYAQKPWEQIAERLCIPDESLKVVPLDGQFITTGVDVQVDHWVFVQVAWSAGARGAVINYGASHSWNDLKRDVLQQSFKHADDGPPLPNIFTLVDARDGSRTDEVIGFCSSVNNKSGPWVLPCMGTNPGTMSGKPYTRRQLNDQGRVKGRSRRRGLMGLDSILVNTNYYQSWIHNALDRRLPEDGNSLRFPESSRHDEELFDQLLSEFPEWKRSNVGDEVVQWMKKSKDAVNDLRDCLRYARCAADVYVSQNWERVAKYRTLTTAKTVPNQEFAERKAREQKKQATESGPKKPRWVRRMSVR